MPARKKSKGRRTAEADGHNPPAKLDRKVDIDHNRTRYDGKPRITFESQQAARRRYEIENGETSEAAARRDPLRHELQAILAGDKVGDDSDVRKLLEKLEPQEGELTRNCYGVFDSSAFECSKLCPLSVECSAKTRQEGSATQVVGAADETPMSAVVASLNKS